MWGRCSQGAESSANIEAAEHLGRVEAGGKMRMGAVSGSGLKSREADWEPESVDWGPRPKNSAGTEISRIMSSVLLSFCLYINFGI